MIVIVPEKRRDGRSSFLQLISYLICRVDKKPGELLSPDNPYVRPVRSREAIVEHLGQFIEEGMDLYRNHVLSRSDDGRQQVLCGEVLCETNCFGIETAAAEMDAVASQNRRCQDPVYHAILSWREEDNPTNEQIFECARYALKALNMSDHQYVFAIHRDTEHVHCHITVNRINPKTYRAASLYDDYFRLHKACRELEQKYGFTPDNGCCQKDENGNWIRKQEEFKSIPRKARQMEYHADKESLYSYAVDEARHTIGKILHSGEATWEALHTELIRLGLELKEKGEGLAVYSRHDDTVTPIKASTLHPDLTKRVLEPYLGKFTPSPVVENYFDENDNYLGSNYPQEYVYDVRAHKRDIGASSARREERADAREALKARYNAYRADWTRPEMDRDEIRARFYHVSGQFAWRRAQVRAEIRDPLLRKLAYNVLALERRQAMIALKETLREERKAFYARPENRRMGYWQWVEQQALNNDAAAISCLRGRFYMQKKMQQENRLSENAIVCAVADDIRPYEIEGYQTQITRDGRIQYCQDGEVKLQDTGDRIEIADPYSQDGQHIAGAMVLAEVKSGERMYFAGEPQFVNKACSIVPWFNEGSEKSLPLTDRAQRQMAGYDTAPVSPQKDEPEIARESLRWLMEGAPKTPVQDDVRQQQKHDYVHDDSYSSRYRRH